MVPLEKHTDIVSRSLCHSCSEMDSHKQMHVVWYTTTYKHQARMCAETHSCTVRKA